MLAFILFLLLGGLIIGAIARLLVPGPNPMGIGGTILLGIAGSFVGGLIGRALFGARSAGSFILAVIAAVVLLLLFQGGRRRRGPLG
jgi:uncharacterized membrane protein YeaQ/YmgE (transglycosylase-associated protein family)